MIDLAKLIALHDGHSGLPHSLGDGYLYTHNKVFANVRDVVQAKGFVFSHHWNQLYAAPDPGGV